SPSSPTTGDPGTTARGCSTTSPGRRLHCSTPSRRRRATREGWRAPTRRSSLRSSSAQPDLGPGEAEPAVDERLGEVRRNLPRAVREEALAVVVEAADVTEAGVAQEALEAARAVAHLGDAVLVARFAALKPVLPVRLDEKEPPARFERLARGLEDEVGAAAVVEGVVEERGVEVAVGVEALHVGDLEVRVDVFPFGKLTRDRDHLGRDVVAVRVEPVSRCEAGHPAGAAAELDQAHARVQVEDLEY